MMQTARKMNAEAQEAVDKASSYDRLSVGH